MDIVVWVAIIGAFLGIVVSVIFGVFSKAGANVYTRTLFGISSSNLITDGIVLLMVATIVFLTGVSIVVRDGTYPTAHPFYFTIETLLMGFLPAIPLLLMTIFRGYPIGLKSMVEFAILVSKFAGLHVLLQYSGFYSTVFPPLL
jgi:hypothetical protein